MPSEEQPWAGLLQEGVHQHKDRSAELRDVRAQVPGLRDLLQRVLREPDVRQEELQRMQYKVQERGLLYLWDVRLRLMGMNEKKWKVKLSFHLVQLLV